MARCISLTNYGNLKLMHNKHLFVILGIIGGFSVTLGGCLETPPATQGSNHSQISPTPTDTEAVDPLDNPPVPIVANLGVENGHDGPLTAVQNGLALRVNGSVSMDVIQRDTTHHNHFVDAGNEGKFIVVYITLKNMNTNSNQISSLEVHLRDNQGRMFERVQTIHEDFIIGLWAEDRGLFNPRDLIPPKTSVETVIVFRAIPDVQPWEMLVGDQVFPINPSPAP